MVNNLKLLMSCFISIASLNLIYTQSCNDLYIAGIIDGPLSGGVPKAIQVCANAHISDLSIFGLGSANNGGGSNGIEFDFPSISIDSGQCYIVSTETSGFQSFFGCLPDTTSSVSNINGDDAIELFCNGILSDIYGDVNIDGTGQTWDYTDGWATASDIVPSVLFDDSEWNYSGANALDGETSNSTALIPYPIFNCFTDCTIDNIQVGNQTACDPTNDTYSQELIITYSMAPSTGFINVNNQQFPITASPQSVVLTHLNADGLSVDVNVYFTEDVICQIDMPDLFTAPIGCSIPGNGELIDTLKIMSYNILNFPNPGNNDINGSDASRVIIFRSIVDSLNPDAIIIQELKSLNGMILLTNELNANGALGYTYDYAPMWVGYSGLGNGLIYKTSKFDFQSQLELPRNNSMLAPNNNTVIAPRANSLYCLKATNENCSDSIDLSLISVHLKAGSSEANGSNISDRDRRNLGVLDILDHTNTLSQTANVIVAGDTNFRSDNNSAGGDSEPAYVNLISSSNSLDFFDPLGGFTRNITSDADKYTQATRSTGTNQFGNAGVSGGLDDRFDFIFISESINNNTNNIKYIDNSYETPGSPMVLNDEACDSGLPNCLDYYYMSDHYPVTIEVEVKYTTCGNPCQNSEFISFDFINNENLQIEALVDINANNTIGGGSEIIYRAGTEINLNPGFEVLTNALFDAIIGDCINN